MYLSQRATLLEQARTRTKTSDLRPEQILQMIGARKRFSKGNLKSPAVPVRVTVK